MALQFDGGAYLDASSAPATSAPLSLTAWCRVPAVVNFTAFALGSASGNDLFGIGCSSSQKVYATIRVGGAWNIISTVSNYPINQWFHVAGVFPTGVDIGTYLDGGSYVSGTASSAPTGIAATRIRNRPGIATTDAGIEIAEVAAWTAALDSQEVALLAAGLSPLALGARLGDLVLYQDLIAGKNRPGIGPLFTQVGGVSAVSHPRVVYPTAAALAVAGPPTRFIGVAEASVVSTGAEAAEAFATGASAGLVLNLNKVAA